MPRKGLFPVFYPLAESNGYQEWKELGFDVVNMQPTILV